MTMIAAPGQAMRRPSPPGRWLRGYGRMAAWDIASLRLYLPVLSCVLILQGAGFVYGMGLLFAGDAAVRRHVRHHGGTGDEPHHRRADLRAAAGRPAADAGQL